MSSIRYIVEGQPPTCTATLEPFYGLFPRTSFWQGPRTTHNCTGNPMAQTEACEFASKLKALAEEGTAVARQRGNAEGRVWEASLESERGCLSILCSFKIDRLGGLNGIASKQLTSGMESLAGSGSGSA